MANRSWCRRDGIERASPVLRRGGKSCALWRIRAVATGNRRRLRDRPLRRDSASVDAAGNIARRACAQLAIATPASRDARTNRIKRGVFLHDAQCVPSSAVVRRDARRRCRARIARPVAATAATAGGNFFATGC
jgi:hypothetical protein